MQAQVRAMEETLEAFRKEAIHLDSALRAAREQFSNDRAKWDERAERYKAQIVRLKSDLVKANSRLVVHPREAVV